MAALYEVLNPWGPGDDFDLAPVMQAASVPDVGCGTGAILRRARQAGHPGRLCGLDPDLAAPSAAGLEVEAHYGTWSREPLGLASPEIITLARA